MQSQSRTNIRLRLPVLLGIQLHPKTPDSLRLRLRLHNPERTMMKKAWELLVYLPFLLWYVMLVFHAAI